MTDWELMQKVAHILTDHGQGMTINNLLKELRHQRTEASREDIEALLQWKAPVLTKSANGVLAVKYIAGKDLMGLSGV